MVGCVVDLCVVGASDGIIGGKYKAYSILYVNGWNDGVMSSEVMSNIVIGKRVEIYSAK